MWLPWVLRLCLGKKPDKPPPDATAKPQDEDESVGPSTPMAQPPHIVEPDQDEPVPTPTLHKRDDVVVPLKEVILQRTCKSSLVIVVVHMLMSCLQSQCVPQQPCVKAVPFTYTYNLSQVQLLASGRFTARGAS